MNLSRQYSYDQQHAACHQYGRSPLNSVVSHFYPFHINPNVELARRCITLYQATVELKSTNYFTAFYGGFPTAPAIYRPFLNLEDLEFSEKLI
jgi:hypothetical protein